MNVRKKPRKKILTDKADGRPKKDIDWIQFDKLCALQCTEVEICDWFDMTDKTLCARCKETHGVTFSELFRQKRGKGKVALRRMQFQTAEKGNAIMQIFLGKQYLKQSDKQDNISSDGSMTPQFIFNDCSKD